MRISKVKRTRVMIDKIVSQIQEDKDTSGRLLNDTFNEAYDELRRVAPKGNLHIHLYIEETDEPATDKRVFRTGTEAGK